MGSHFSTLSIGDHGEEDPKENTIEPSKGINGSRHFTRGESLRSKRDVVALSNKLDVSTRQPNEAKSNKRGALMPRNTQYLSKKTGDGVESSKNGHS